MSLRGNNNAEKIWNFLTDNGLTAHGAAGLMGNLQAESGLVPNNLQNTYEKSLGMTDAAYTAAVDSGSYANFVRDSAGYGLAQWTYWSRKEALLNYARSRGASIGDLEMQLGFLLKELAEDFAGVLATLKKTGSILEASNAVLLNFERPANQGTSVQNTRAGYGQTFFDQFASKTTTSNKGGTTMSGKITTAAELAQRAENAAKNYKTLYVMGCFGAPMNDANKKRYTTNHSYNKDPARTKMINAASADTFGFDCVCLIKGLLWGWCGDASKQYGGAGYAINGVPDIGADSMIRVCSDVSTDFSKIEIGEAVWMEGHIGLYIGGGLAVECTPKWSNNVQITACNNTRSGYNTRNWTKHGKLPYVTYTGKSEDVKTAGKSTGGSSGNTGGSTGGNTGSGSSSLKFSVGQIVNFSGGYHYTSANASSGPAVKASRAKITDVYPSGKHPYHACAVNEAGNFVGGVYGWVDEKTLSAISTGSSSGGSTGGNTSKELKVGDIVNFTGSVHYVSEDATTGPAAKPGKAKITKIVKGGKHPYHIIHVDSSSNVYGWVDAADIGAAAPAADNWTPAVGDIVNFTGSVHYANANAATGPSCKPGKAKITQIYLPNKSKHPYHLKAISGSSSTVYGWVDRDAFTKS